MLGEIFRIEAPQKPLISTILKAYFHEFLRASWGATWRGWSVVCRGSSLPSALGRRFCFGGRGDFLDF